MSMWFSVLYACSGFCVLALETFWIRQAGLCIGNTTESATLIIGVFFFCAAAGNLVGGRMARSSVRPAQMYGFCELLTALSSAGLFLSAGWLKAMADVDGMPAGAAHLLYAVALAGVPSFFAGMTFPALSQAFVHKADERTRAGGWFYALNLAGAAAGVIGGGLLLPQVFGYRCAMLAVSGILAGIGIIAFVLGRNVVPAAPDASGRRTEPAELRISAPLAVAILAGSGVLSLTLEILSLHYFHLMTTSSIYSVSAVLFAYVVDLGSGCLLITVLRQRWPAEKLLRFFLWAAAALVLIYPHVLQYGLERNILPHVSEPLRYAWRISLTAALLLMPLLLAVGAIFPLAWELVERGRLAQGEALGRIVSLNKLGAAAGACLAPFLLVPLCGLPGAFAAVGGGYGVLAAFSLSSWRRRIICGGGVAAAAVVLFVGQPQPIRKERGEELRALYSSVAGIVAVVDEHLPGKEGQPDDASRHIILNQTYSLNGTSRALIAQRHQSWLPLLLHPRPRRVLYIGVASGISAGAALDFPIEHLDAAELIPEVVRAAREHFSEWNNNLFSDPRAHILLDDGRHVLQTAREAYDLVICDLLVPCHEGTSAIYSRDFFEEVKRKLAPQGRFCLWLPVYQMDEEVGSVTVRTFAGSFPSAVMLRGNFDPVCPVVGLLGGNDKLDLSDESLSCRLQSDSARRLAAVSLFFRSLPNLRLSLIGDLHAADPEFSSAGLNSDDYPAIAFRAPALLSNNALMRFTFLNWIGKRFLRPEYPSCELGATDPETVLRGVRASNQFFAASVVNAMACRSLNETLDRQRGVERQLLLARNLSPASEIKQVDLR